MDYTGRVDDWYNNTFWYKEGRLHRIKGPAIIYRNIGNTSRRYLYYIEGNYIPKKDFKNSANLYICSEVLNS